MNPVGKRRHYAVTITTKRAKKPFQQLASQIVALQKRSGTFLAF